MTEQAQNIERVSDRIGNHVLAFVNHRLSLGVTKFYIEELRRYVSEQVSCLAPDSPGRILRMLRRENKLDYKVLSRSESLYEIVRVIQ